MNFMKRNILVGLLGLMVIVGSIFIVFALQRSGASNEPTHQSKNNEQLQPLANNSTGEKMELKIEDIETGTGAEAVPGKQVTVHYVGTLENGTEFDSSRSRNQPFTFALGAGQVIRGWDEGFAGMKVGGKRKLVIPPEMAYGSQAVGSIPPNSTLVFDVELLDVK